MRPAHMANFEENVEEMVETTREVAAVATESGGATRRRRRLVIDAMSDLLDLLVTPQPFACRVRTTTLFSQSLAPIQKVRD